METTDELADLMQEAPGGDNHGSRSTPDWESWNRSEESKFGNRIGLSIRWAQAHEYIRRGGFSVVDTNAGTHTGRTHGYQDAGMKTHRGPLHGMEFVHHDELINMVEGHLGFTFDEVRSVYAREGGPLPGDLRELRSQIDDRLLRLREDGHLDMTEFSRVFGLSEKTIRRAVQRAKA